ncbi:GGDEF domain-containing protein [Desulfosarcina alkanivorans]|uniref:diguanylate cyclase n=1 Tax=Desulfosarcina alkanivorans TaxID=571177 RepID=A0A5K7YVD8_9BACT|nr:sensor domain-containing diguanylate cyclase [Desulfosarcina alkanivorans]BBO71999.1 GGDEF domain-containing protein [Desulfosarcina alkanivorans]
MKSGSRLSREQLLSCLEFGKALTSELDPNRLLKRIMEKISRLFPSETWSLLLLDETTETLRFELSIDLDLEQMKTFRLPLGQSAAGRCALTQELLVLEDVRQYEFFHGKVDELSGCRTESLVCVPILFAGRTLGVLEMVNPRSLDEASITLLALISDYLAIGMENTRRFRKLRDMAIRDSLTGLYNQRHLYRSLEALMAKCKAGGGCFSLIFLDIDDFKTVVDAEGHLNGSRTLREVGQKIKGCLDASSFAVAYGGDEFVVVLPDADSGQAAETAREIRESIRAATFLARWGRSVQVTASFGVATFPDHAGDIKALLALADQAMFRVKNTGKDRVGLSLNRPGVETG